MIKAIILMLLAILSVCLILFEMASLELANGTTEWSTVSSNIAGLIIFIIVIGVVLLIWRGRD